MAIPIQASPDALDYRDGELLWFWPEGYGKGNPIELTKGKVSAMLEGFDQREVLEEPCWMTVVDELKAEAYKEKINPDTSQGNEMACELITDFLSQEGNTRRVLFEIPLDYRHRCADGGCDPSMGQVAWWYLWEEVFTSK
jgi:hypothetical protein